MHSALVQQSDAIAPADLLSAAAHSIAAGLIGSGIDKSRTPGMHRAEGMELGLDYEYRLINTDRLPQPTPDLRTILDRLEAGGFKGLNITHPFKQDALELVDELSANAEATGAINTIVFHDGRRIGHNTDCRGFERAFAESMDDAPRDTVVLLGAGGAGGAVAKALIDQGVGSLLVFDPELARARALVERVTSATNVSRAAVSDDIAEAIKGADGLVNATPVGMEAYPGCPVDPGLITSDLWVADIVYIPLETELLRYAREAGCRTVSGAGMAVYQAVRAFELFTGQAANAERMKETFAAF